MRRLSLILALAALVGSTPAIGQSCSDDWLEPRAPSSIGDPTMAPAMDALLAAYRVAHLVEAPPTVWSHPGEAVAIGALMFARADMTPITRSFTAAELAPYDHQFRGDMMKFPLLVRIGVVEGRPAAIAVNQRPDSPLPLRIARFLDFALSPSGREVLAAVPGFAPLDPAETEDERNKLTGFLASLDSALPIFRPLPRLAGEIRSVGSDGMKDLMDGWHCRFVALHPSVRKGERWEHLGTLNGFHALLAGEADIAPMGRELWPQEAEAWRSLFGTAAPVEVRVARGGFNTPQRTTAQAIFVHPSNPLRGLSTVQLAALFGSQPKITQWGQLGLGGEWEERPIHIRMPSARAPNAMSLQIMLGLQGWSEQAVQAPIAETAQALLTDPLSIGFGGLEEGAPGLKALALSRGPGEPLVPLDAENASTGRWPLTRHLYIRLAHNKPRRQVLAFLRYVLSREGQERVRYSGYFPLRADEAAAELAKLDVLERSPD